jgi:hypothetical protein
LGKEDFERFRIYGFAVDYPYICRIEFNPKSRREGGDVVFHFPQREKIYLSWGELEKVRKKFPTVDEHAEHSTAVVKKNRSIKNFQTVSKDTLGINSHTAVYSHVKLSEVQPGMFLRSREIGRDVYSVHLHCDQTGKYFVLYALVPSEAGSEFEDVFKLMANSFECHS